MKYQFESRIRYSETDMAQKLSLVSLVDYFQDCSTFQSEALGIGIDYLKMQHRVWMVLSWQIEIIRLPSLGEKVTVQTWPYSFKAFYGNRNFAMLDEQGNYLAKANSVWVLMDTETGRPVKPDPEHIGLYVLEEPLEMEYSSRKLAVEGEAEVQDSFVVGRHHLDSNHHVNNGQYISMAEDYLPAGYVCANLKVEYRQQAKLHDTIVPMVYRKGILEGQNAGQTSTGQEMMVSLCDAAEKPYAVVSFSQGKL